MVGYYIRWERYGRILYKVWKSVRWIVWIRVKG